MELFPPFHLSFLISLHFALPPQLMLGDTLNFGDNLEWEKIQIEGEIGRGNFGCVYKVLSWVFMGFR